MLQLLIEIGRALALELRGHRELVLENLALRLPGPPNKWSTHFLTTRAPRRCTAIATASTARSSGADWTGMGIAEVVAAPASPWQNPHRRSG